MGSTNNNFMCAVMIPAVIITVVIVIPMMICYELDVAANAAPIKREIAQNFASAKWNFNCELAKKWDSTVPCPYH